MLITTRITLKFTNSRFSPMLRVSVLNWLAESVDFCSYITQRLVDDCCKKRHLKLGTCAEENVWI
jgi:hypothetical protein